MKEKGKNYKSIYKNPNKEGDIDKMKRKL